MTGPDAMYDFVTLCAACGVNERADDSRYCKSCSEALEHP